MKQALLAVSLSVSMIGMAQNANKISGFTEKTTAKQQQLEQQYDAQLSTKRIDQTVKELSAMPHHLGSKGGNEVVQSIYNKFKQWGWDVKIET